jgi:hypothetical protein
MKDSATMTNTAAALQVAKVEGVSASDFRTNMVDNWQKLNAKAGGNIYGKIFIPYGKEGELGEDIMTSIIHHKNQFLKNSKHRIIHNLNGIDEIISACTMR